MFRIDRPLYSDKLLVELGQGQPGWQHRMLDVEQAVVARPQPALLDQPAFGSGIWGIDADIDNFRLFETPFAQHTKPLAVPIGIDDQVDRQVDAERAGKFQRFEVAPERYALSIFLQALVVDCLEPEKHVGDAERLP